MRYSSVIMTFFVFLFIAVSSTAGDNKNDLNSMLHDAERGNPDSQRKLAMLYYLGGDGVTQDNDKAFLWFEKAANNGDAWSQSHIGSMYYNGYGVPQNYKKALSYIEAAARNGYMPAQFALAEIYYSGRGAEKNYEKAAYWYESAAYQGNDSAQFVIGLMYLLGDGVSVDHKKAYTWLSLSRAKGNHEAGKSMSMAESSLSPKEVEEAQQEAARIFENEKSFKK